MVKGRKGEGWIQEHLVTIIVVIFSIGVATMIISGFTSSANAAIKDDGCRASVALRGKAVLDLGLTKVENILPLSCPSQKVGQVTGSREQVKKQIADMASRCWFRFVEGSVPDVFNAAAGEKVCRICFTFTIKDSLEPGKTAPRSEQLFIEPTHEKGKISWQEMYNYLIYRNYNPSLMQGGGTKNYLRAYYDDWSTALNLGEPRELKVKYIKETAVHDYVLDYTSQMTDAQIEEIRSYGRELLAAERGNLLVIAADELNSLNPGDMDDLARSLKLNKNSTYFNAILIVMDRENHLVRVSVGYDVSHFIKEWEINDMLQEEFEKVKEGGTNEITALLKVTQRMKDRILNQESTEFVNLNEIERSSYFFYLSNAGYNWPLIKDLDSDSQLVVAYLSPTKDTTKKEEWTILMPWTDMEASDIGFDIKKLFSKSGTLYEYYRPNNIVIMPRNEVIQYCDEG